MAQRAAAFLLILVAVPLAAQPLISPGGVVNAASFQPPTLPGGAIAQGSIFSIFGSDLGPRGLAAQEFPLSDTLGGVSVEIRTADAGSFLCPMLYAGANQVNAILPSQVPAGQHLVAVIRDGVSSEFVPVKVVRTSFGIFLQLNNVSALNAAAQIDEGGRPRLLADGRSARPGDVITLWGTGLGPVDGPEDRPPAAGPSSEQVQAIVGGRPAQVEFQGRSACCVGLDQINLRLSSSTPIGCLTPIVIVSQGVVSNVAVIPTSPDGSACHPTPGPKPARVNLQRIWEGDDPPLDIAAALFGQIVAQLDPTQLPPRGSCLIHRPFGPLAGGIGEPPPGADSVVVRGPAAEIELLPEANFMLVSPPALPFLGVGPYQIESRGGQYPEFTANLPIPPAPLWTNQAELPAFFRASGLRLEWTGGDPDSDLVVWSRPADDIIDLVCRARVGDGELIIPREMLANLAGDRRTIVLGSATSAPLEFVTDGPETGLVWHFEQYVEQADFGLPHLPSTPVTLPNGDPIQAELATSSGERQRGLMLRPFLAADRGMLFLFEAPALWRFWMFNTLVPLDILWLDADRRVIFINADTPPCPPLTPCPTYGADEPSRFVLELAAGEAERRGLRVGDQLAW